ncbi:hypothetical protein HN51_018567 [Arachis hypogaea]|uniref:J domain-containing protein n=2 Tax=Arachis TaxID=3817 RepID=A0A445BTQ7_ARAHY|nr:dnaJ homolog subfamily B member 14 [Arachis hypogaea]QHO30158.1 uncharacterized protein DS421_8g230940 [Arachis hypogaea]RYR42090.1 hypothetical protein Ahy_A08g038543 [Arachis hypogaea]
MQNNDNNKEEAERLIGIAEKLLQNRDLNGAKDFAILAQETEPLLETSDQILAIADVLLVSDATTTDNTPQWYQILQVDVLHSQDLHVIRSNYRRLALLLHPDKNRFPFAQHAFALVSDAWSVLSDPAQKLAYDAGLNRAQGNVSGSVQQEKLPVRRGSDPYSGNFWTACPYCYLMYEYPRVYEGCCLRCQNDNCERSFHGAAVTAMPPLVPGEEKYYCNWGFFPMGFVFESLKSNGNAAPQTVASDCMQQPVPVAVAPAAVDVSGSVGSRKRGRPRRVV